MASLGYIEIVVAFLCFLYFWAKRNDENLPRSWPIVGMLPGLLMNLQNIHQNCTRILNLTGGTFLFKGTWFSKQDMLLTGDPANVHHIMSANFQNFPKGQKFREIFDVLGDGIFNSDMDSWKKQRKLARLLINHQEFHKFLVKTSRNKVEKGLIPVLDKFFKSYQEFDLQDLFQRFTFDTTCTLVTGYDPGCLSVDLPEVPFSRAMDDAEEAILMRHIVPEIVWKLQRWLGVGEEKKLSQAWRVLDQVIGNYISLKREELEEKSGRPGNDDDEGVDLLTSYLNESENMDLKCDDKFLRDSILNLMIAGRDTTSSALTWFTWLVSTHPDVEMKIREEINSVLPPGEVSSFRLFTVEDTNQLVYLHAALCESLRLYPPVPFQHKEPLQAEILPSGHYVNPKIKVMFSLYAMGRMVTIWGKDCSEFKPERWISERGSIKHEPSYKFLVFNAGPRTCLGKEVAFTQMKMVAATIIHNYKIQMVEEHQVYPNVSVILYMKNGFKVKITNRW
ncbi:hypothetical protein Leryth_015658 [Lithospermum erythrorhizon]|nr:hypothetical protein Leryth_015658 [Lithospermum erythrorhizon]